MTAQWRRYIARKKFLDLRHAADVFASNYKRLQVQRYVKKYRAAAAVVRKFIFGFMNRNKPKCADNIYYLDFVRVDFLVQLSKKLPPKLVGFDSNWPAPPPPFRDASEQLKEMYRITLMRKFMRPLTVQQRAMYTLKLTASELFRNKKQCYPASVPHPFVTSHLAHNEIQSKQANFNARYPNIGTEKFSLSCVKHDRRGYKPKRRIVILTDSMLFMLDAGNFKLKEQVRYDNITGIEVSHLNDGVVIVKLPTEGSGERGDLILRTDCVIEFVMKLALYSGRLDQVSVNSTGTIVHHMPKGATGTITFQTGNIDFAGKGRSGQMEVVSSSDL